MSLAHRRDERTTDHSSVNSSLKATEQREKGGSGEERADDTTEEREVRAKEEGEGREGLGEERHQLNARTTTI